MAYAIKCQCGTEVNVKLSFCPKLRAKHRSGAPGRSSFRGGHLRQMRESDYSADGLLRGLRSQAGGAAPPSASPFDKLKSKASDFLKRD